jgi:digeranylgeranylglycerophospholipid reductase
MRDVEFLIVGCGPAGGVAAREAARGGVETLVLERDAVVGAKRVCAGGLRDGFCENFDLPRSIVHCDPPTIALHALSGRRFEFPIGEGLTTTREELDGTIAGLARAEGAQIQTSALFRGYSRDGERSVVEYADLLSGERKRVRARHVLLAQGSSARIPEDSPLAYPRWESGLITCYQYRVYPERPALPVTYQTLELHYYLGAGGRNVVAWMFPKRDHLSIGLGIPGKLGGKALRAELDTFLAGVAERLFPGTAFTVREEGNLLYGGAPRPRVRDGGVMIGGTAAGLVDATTGEGIQEAAVSGRLAAAAVTWAKGRPILDAALRYERSLKATFYARLRQRHSMMTFLERRPVRFDLLFEQLARYPRLADLLQRERHDFSFGEWLYLYGQAALFSLRALRS